MNRINYGRVKSIQGFVQVVHLKKKNKNKKRLDYPPKMM